MKLGMKLAERRKGLGITQAEIAEKMHVTRQTVSRWESETAFPDIEKVAELAKILDVSCDYLLKDDGLEGAACDTYMASEPSPLLKKLIGRQVKLNFYDEETDIDVLDKICMIKGFEGNWMDIEVLSGKKTLHKLVAVSSILSVEIVQDR